MNPRIAFFGTPKFSVPILESIHNEYSVVVVISQPEKPVGKGGKVTPSAVAHFAHENDLPLYTPSKLNEPEFKQFFQNLNLDLAVVVAYGKILPQWVLDVPKHGAINIHASLLPQYRGASPISASILHGDSKTGISYIIMNSKMDEGDIIYQSDLSIDSDESTESLSIKLSNSASKDINMVINKFIVGELKTRKQDSTQATYCSILSKVDGQIDFANPPSNLERMIRAYHPWPGVWGMFRGKRVKLLPDNKVQMEGKKITEWDSFKNGYPDFPLRSI